MKFDIINRQKISKNCFVCGIENDLGLKTKFYETSNDEVIGIFMPNEKLQSYPKILHGGISATILDETIGRAMMIKDDKDTFGVTIELTIRYRKPVPLNQELKVIAKITNDRGKLVEGTGKLILPNGDVAVTAKGKYMRKNIKDIFDDKFATEEWIESDAKDLKTIQIGNKDDE